MHHDKVSPVGAGLIGAAVTLVMMFAILGMLGFLGFLSIGRGRRVKHIGSDVSKLIVSYGVQ